MPFVPTDRGWGNERRLSCKRFSWWSPRDLPRPEYPWAARSVERLDKRSELHRFHLPFWCRRLLGNLHLRSSSAASSMAHRPRIRLLLALPRRSWHPFASFSMLAVRHVLVVPLSSSEALIWVQQLCGGISFVSKMVTHDSRLLNLCKTFHLLRCYPKLHLPRQTHPPTLPPRSSLAFVCDLVALHRVSVRLDWELLASFSSLVQLRRHWTLLRTPRILLRCHFHEPDGHAHRV